MSSISGSSLSITGSTTLNGLSVGSGTTTLSSVQTGHFSQSGSSTFSTGGGLVSLNGSVTTNGTASVGTNLIVNGTSSLIGATTATGIINANGGVKIPVDKQFLLSVDGNNYITNSTNSSTGSGSITYATFDSGKTHDFYCYNGSKIYTISSTGTNTNGTGNFTGALTATSGVTTGNSAKITTKCSTATRYGEINTNSDGNTMFNIISEITGNGYFFMYNTSTELLRVNPTEITASKVINANAGVNAGSTTIQTTGTVSCGTGVVTGLFYTGGSSTSTNYMRIDGVSNSNCYFDLKNSGTYYFRQNLGTSAVKAPIDCEAITASGLLTANSGIASTGLIRTIGSGGAVTSNGLQFPNVVLTTNTGYRLQIPVGSWNKDTNNNTTILDCYRVGNNGGIYDNYVGINASSSPAGGGFCINSQMDFVIGATSAQYLVKGMSIQAQSSSAVNVGINNTNPQYALDVSGTGNFTGALTANAGVKIPTGLQLFLSTDGNNYITNNSTNAKIQYVTFDAGKSHDFWVVDGSKFNISQTGTNTYGTASVSSLFYVGGTSSSSTYMRLEANINNNNGYIDLKNGGSFCFRQNLGTSAIDAPIVCGAITSSGAITANGGITVPSGQTLTIASGASLSYGGGLTLGGNITLASTFTTPTSGQLGYTISGSNNSTQALVSNTTRTFATIFLPVGVWMITAMPAYICTTATSTAGIYQFGISTTTDSPSSICGYHNGISSVDASMFSFTQSINISTSSTMIYLRGRVYFPAGAGTVTVHSSTSINAIRIA